MFLWFRYSTLSDNDLLQLPVADLSAANALVIVWVTNKLRQQRFVKDRLFPHWNVTCLAQWYWLKVVYIPWFVGSLSLHMFQFSQFCSSHFHLSLDIMHACFCTLFSLPASVHSCVAYCYYVLLSVEEVSVVNFCGRTYSTCYLSLICWC